MKQMGYKFCTFMVHTSEEVLGFIVNFLKGNKEFKGEEWDFSQLYVEEELSEPFSPMVTLQHAVLKIVLEDIELNRETISGIETEIVPIERYLGRKVSGQDAGKFVLLLKIKDGLKKGHDFESNIVIRNLTESISIGITEWDTDNCVVAIREDLFGAFKNPDPMAIGKLIGYLPQE